GALSRGLEKAAAQRKLHNPASTPMLKIALWHHPITGNEKIFDDAFMQRLQNEGIKVCLHGHIHEERADIFNYLDRVKQINIIGAGSFGAVSKDRPESTPNLYNLLEIERDFSSVKVHTRALHKPLGAWEGWAKWPSEKPDHRRTYYQFDLFNKT